MHESYLIVACGYEGIDSIVGAFATGEEAAKKLKAWRPLCLKCKGEYPEEEGYTIAKQLWSVEPNRLCIQRVSSESSAQCCCNEFGVGPDELLLY